MLAQYTTPFGAVRPAAQHHAPGRSRAAKAPHRHLLQGARTLGSVEKHIERITKKRRFGKLKTSYKFCFFRFCDVFGKKLYRVSDLRFEGMRLSLTTGPIHHAP